ncbi:MAG: acyl-CoA desaturase [Gemmataceae bacterium]|nr:acyl-CoA desaturase [Gemmataceae bacterium]
MTPIPAAAPDSPHEAVAEPLSLAARAATLTAVFIPHARFGAAGASVWGWGLGWVEFGLLAGMYVLSALGITVGFHRLFTHKSFETNAVVRFVLAALGSMAVQGSVLRWVAYHRRHHQHSDTPDDPHSPHHAGGRGLWGVVRGFWHSHIGWAFKPDPVNLDRYVADLKKLTSVRAADALFPLWIVLGLAAPAALGGVLTGSWAGALLGLLWGGLVRVFLVHHVTWSVNSVCHLWGSRPYPEKDHSRNNLLFGLLAMGEGWHNNHHAFPSSARHGLRWWQVDASYYVIRLMAWAGLAWKVRLPAGRPAGIVA